jgi:T-complex protein 1 subunit eta
LLERCATTTLSSKLIGGKKLKFVKMVVDLVTTLGEDNCLNIFGVKKVIPVTSSSMSAQSMLRSL